MAPAPAPSLTSDQLDAYVARLGLDPRGAPADLATLRAVHLAHLEQIPFENLDIAFGNGVPHDQLAAVDKIAPSEPPTNAAAARRGGWCFELNGALALLLEALGYRVRLLGAAVLSDGPTQVIEHLLLEVESPLLTPHLADVGFGDSFDVPISLNTAGPQDGGSGDFELIGSPQGTTLTRHVDEVPRALLRFKRVAHAFTDFAAVARSMQSDPSKHWSSKPFATRLISSAERALIEQAPRRVTMTSDRLKLVLDSGTDESAIGRDVWPETLTTWFGMTPPGPWPTQSRASRDSG